MPNDSKEEQNLDQADYYYDEEVLVPEYNKQRGNIKNPERMFMGGLYREQLQTQKVPRQKTLIIADYRYRSGHRYFDKDTLIAYWTEKLEDGFSIYVWQKQGLVPVLSETALKNELSNSSCASEEQIYKAAEEFKLFNDKIKIIDCFESDRIENPSNTRGMIYLKDFNLLNDDEIEAILSSLSQKKVYGVHIDTNDVVYLKYFKRILNLFPSLKRVDINEAVIFRLGRPKNSSSDDPFFKPIKEIFECLPSSMDLPEIGIHLHQESILALENFIVEKIPKSVKKIYFTDSITVDYKKPTRALVNLSQKLAGKEFIAPQRLCYEERYEGIIELSKYVTFKNLMIKSRSERMVEFFSGVSLLESVQSLHFVDECDPTQLSSILKKTPNLNTLNINFEYTDSSSQSFDSISNTPIRELTIKAYGLECDKTISDFINNTPFLESLRLNGSVFTSNSTHVFKENTFPLHKTLPLLKKMHADRWINPYLIACIINHAPQLQQLFLDNSEFFTYEVPDLKSLEHLTSLQIDFSDNRIFSENEQRNLRKFLSKCIRLKSLTLSTVFLARCETNLDDFQLPNLQRLILYGNDNSEFDPISFINMTSPGLRVLRFAFSVREEKEQTLKSLPNIQSVNLSAENPSFNAAILKNSQRLQYLRLFGGPFVNETKLFHETFSNINFTQLRSLILENINTTISTDLFKQFPALQRLEMYQCELKVNNKIPPLPHLTTLFICDMRDGNNLVYEFSKSAKNLTTIVAKHHSGGFAMSQNTNILKLPKYLLYLSLATLQHLENITLKGYIIEEEEFSLLQKKYGNKISRENFNIYANGCAPDFIPNPFFGKSQQPSQEETCPSESKKSNLSWDHHTEGGDGTPFILKQHFLNKKDNSLTTRDVRSEVYLKLKFENGDIVPETVPDEYKTSQAVAVDNRVFNLWEEKYSQYANCFCFEMPFDKDGFCELEITGAEIKLLAIESDVSATQGVQELHGTYYVETDDPLNGKTAYVRYIFQKLSAVIDEKNHIVPTNARRFLESVRFSEDGTISYDTDYKNWHYIFNANKSDALRHIASFCLHFQDTPLDQPFKTKIEVMNLAIAEQKGTCIHRALIFKLLCDWFGIECKLGGNPSHIRPEAIQEYNGRYAEYELGGGQGTSLVVPFVPSQPISNKNNSEEKKLESKNPVTSNSRESKIFSPISIQDFFAFIQAELKPIPSDRHNVILKFSSIKQIRPFAFALKRELKSNKKQVFYLDHPKYIFPDRHVLSENNSSEVVDSSLLTFLKTAKAGDILFIRRSRDKNEFVGLNSVTDKPRKMLNTLLEKGVIIISAMLSHEELTMREDERTRHPLSLEVPNSLNIPEDIFNGRVKEIATLPNSIPIISFYNSDDWESKALAAVVMKEQKKTLDPRPFLKYCRLKSTEHKEGSDTQQFIGFDHAPWDYDEFTLFLANALIDGFPLDKDEYEIPSSLEIIRLEQPYQLSQVYSCEILDDKNCGLWEEPLNSSTYSYFEKIVVHRDTEIILTEGHLKEYRDKVFPVLVRKSFKIEEWSYLLSLAEKHQCFLRLIFDPRFPIPDFLIPGAKIKEEKKLEPSKEQENIQVLICNDLNTASTAVLSEHKITHTLTLNNKMDYSLIEAIQEEAKHDPVSSRKSSIFKRKVGLLWQWLSEGSNVLIICDQASDMSLELQSRFETLFSRKPHLLINGKNEPITGKIIFLTTDAKLFNFVKPIVTPSTPKLLPPSQLKFEIKETKLIETLEVLTEKRRQLVNQALQNSPCVVIQGPPGCGKHHFMTQMKTTLFIGVKNIKAWASHNDKSISTTLLLDDYNSILDNLSNGGVVIDNEWFPINPSLQKVVLISNQSITKIPCEMVQFSEYHPSQIHEILSSVLSKITPSACQVHINDLIKLITTHYPSHDMNALIDAGINFVVYWLNYGTRFSEDERYKAISSLALYDILYLHSQIKNPLLVKTTLFNDEKTFTRINDTVAFPKDSINHFVITKFWHHPLRLIFSQLTASQLMDKYVDAAQVGKRIFILNGDSGIGKTSLILNYFESLGQQYLHLQDFDPDSIQNTLLEAFRKKLHIVCDEINTIYPLLHQLADLFRQFPNVRIFATENPISFPNRRLPPPDLEKFICRVTLPPFPKSELMTVLQKKGFSPEETEQLMENDPTPMPRVILDKAEILRARGFFKTKNPLPTEPTQQTILSIALQPAS